MTQQFAQGEAQPPLDLGALLALGWLQAGDCHFARFCADLDGGLQGARRLNFEVLAAAVCRFLREGHSCVPLSLLGEVEVKDDEGIMRGQLPPLDEFREAIAQANAIGLLAAEASDATHLVLSTPLVMDEEERIYVARYFDHERTLTRQLARRALAAPQQIDPVWLEERLDHYFPSDTPHPPQVTRPVSVGGVMEENLQRKAAQAALQSRLVTVVGGPGTGKTSTVVKILNLFDDLAVATSQPPFEVMLLAPTGKAAARMMESISAQMSDGSSVSEPLPPGEPIETRRKRVYHASTIHRALGVIPQNPNRYRRGPELKLNADLVIVDEASMVDLALMRHLVSALGENTRLILLGDQHQLASVEAGSVLAELCQELSELRSLALGGAISAVELTKSYRFSSESGIYELSAQIRAGCGEGAVAVLSNGRDDLSWVRKSEGENVQPAISRDLKQLVVSRYAPAMATASAADAARALDEFRVLCAHRKGAFGIEQLNELIRRWLAEHGAVPIHGEFYRGRPILITANDYELHLHNGDIGVVWPDASGALSVYFETADKKGRWVACGHLPAHETAFALTIHKSQGSEYREVVVVLPPPGSPLLSRELIYTGVTRAKKHVHLFGSEASLLAACTRRVERHSGIAAKLRQLLSLPLK